MFHRLILNKATILFSIVACNLIGSEDLIDQGQREYLRSLSLPEEYIDAFPYDEYKVCSVPSQGTFYIETIKDSIKGLLAQGKPWEQGIDALIYRYTKPGTIALDIGAHIGTHTIALSHAVGKDGLVIAFEPQEKICRELCMNMQLNKCTNVIPVHCALGERDAVVGLLTPIAINQGGTYLTDNGPELVDLRRLDDFKIRNISFVKMDVENYEKMVLEGAWETITASRPVILLEIQGNGEQLTATGGNSAELTAATIHLLESMGYKVSLIRACDYLAVPA
jgi:FkbM family methyltransferase